MSVVLGSTAPHTELSGFTPSRSSTQLRIASVVATAQWFASVWELPGLDALEGAASSAQPELLRALARPHQLSAEGLPLVLSGALGAPTAQEREQLAHAIELVLTRRIRRAAVARIKVDYRPDGLLLNALAPLRPGRAAQERFPFHIEVQLTHRDARLFIHRRPAGSLMSWP